MRVRWREFLSWVLVVAVVVFPVGLAVKKVLFSMREYENIAKGTTVPGIDCFNQIKFENHATSPQDQALTGSQYPTRPVPGFFSSNSTHSVPKSENDGVPGTWFFILTVIKHNIG